MEDPDEGEERLQTKKAGKEEQRRVCYRDSGFWNGGGGGCKVEVVEEDFSKNIKPDGAGRWVGDRGSSWLDMHWGLCDWTR